MVEESEKTVPRWKTDSVTERFELNCTPEGHTRLKALSVVSSHAWANGCIAALEFRRTGAYLPPAYEKSVPAENSVRFVSGRGGYRATLAATQQTPPAPVVNPTRGGFAVGVAGCRFIAGERIVRVGDVLACLDRPWPAERRMVAIRVLPEGDCCWIASIMHLPAEPKSTGKKPKPRRGPKKKPAGKRRQPETASDAAG